MTSEAREIMTNLFGILRILEFLRHVKLYFKKIKFYLIKIKTNFNCQPSYLLPG
jgi:hypothetical protein